jgi:hypothetical protein
MTGHDHPPEGPCLPTCPGWPEGALELFAVQRRHADMLAACRAASAIESLIVVPETAGAELPEYLAEESVVRLNLVVGRDCPEVMLDEWGVRVALTFRGRRQDCAFPWTAVMAGVLVAPVRPRPRFAVIEGGRKD